MLDLSVCNELSVSRTIYLALSRLHASVCTTMYYYVLGCMYPYVLLFKESVGMAAAELLTLVSRKPRTEASNPPTLTMPLVSTKNSTSLALSTDGAFTLAASFQPEKTSDPSEMSSTISAFRNALISPVAMGMGDD